MEISIELLLGIIGTITGVFGTIVSTILYLMKYRKEKPILKVTVESCKHKVAKSGNKTDLKCEFIVSNIGDRGTTLNKLELSLYDWNGNLHSQTQDLNIDVEGGSSKPLVLLFEFRPPFQYGENIGCKFVLHHTYDKYRFSTNSEESTKYLSSEGVVIVSRRT